MIRKHSNEESGSHIASEPAAEYGTIAKKSLRVVTDEELARCMTLEESERQITEKIYQFYHPEAH